MATFYYKATNTSGKLETGQLEAGGKAQALAQLERKGLFPLSVTDKQNKSTEFNLQSFKVEDLLPINRISGKDVLDFTDKLATLLKSGLPLAKALALLIDTTSKEPLQDVIREVLKDVKAGNSFADSLAKHEKVFERLYVNMVRTGEAAGVLDQVLENVRNYLEARQNMRSYLVSAMIYPSILAFTGAGTVAVLVFFVLPRFQQVFDQVGQELPFITRLMVDATTFLSDYKWIILVLSLAAWFGFRHWKNSPEGALQWDVFKLKMPVLGNIFTQIEVNRFSNTLGILLNSSVSLLDAMSIAKEIANNRVFQRAMDPIIKGIKKGDGMSGPMTHTGVFPKMAVQLVTVGEETGTLGDMFIKIAGIYQSSLEKSIKRLLAMFEPVMILVMFVVVGMIVAAMLMAVTSLSTTSI
ncbi:Type II secretion system F family protein [Sulfidibacter corallicola]|uniref:Type II secretion system F family protein n=1 Tax=Sulfidibacter corallicola TaxID=2818388 RepID=A0A8A4TV11_SULCO|nr:type II secretion system F family protein [Sulfidibacter corallicola]QTD53360.1 type II secretion system F family protein [Sulfidibacter corallicola]